MASKIKFKTYGWKPDLPDFRDFKYVPPKGAVESLPTMVDMRDQCPEVYDQGELGSCTAQSLAGVIEHREMVQGMKDPQTPSRLFIYYNERVLENTVNEDSGAMLRDGIKSLIRWGYCEERFWPYDISKFKRKPSRAAYKDARNSRISMYQRIGHNLHDMKACLASGNQFVFGFAVFESFESDDVKNTGRMTMPMSHEKMLGGHAVTAVGYDDSIDCFIVRNSWGKGWGDNGYFYMPFTFILNSDFTDDFWSITVVPVDD